MKPRVSVVIPAVNEQALIGAVIDRARGGDPWEVIVVDGGSTDETVPVAEAHGALVMQSSRGRGRQMNRGAAIATGEVLLFLHADTHLPDGWPEHVAGVLGRDDVCAGAFRLSIDAPARALRRIEKAVNWRSRVLGLPYGDQAIFLEAKTFHRLGGFAEADAMEDFELVRRLRRLGRIGIVEAAVVTSARRWLAGGIWRTTMLNQLCVAAYLLGISPRRIAAWRGRADGEPVAPAAAVPQAR